MSGCYRNGSAELDPGPATRAGRQPGDLEVMSTVGRIGFRAGVAASGAMLAYVIVQILQMVGVLHFPLDEILIFGTSLCIVLPAFQRESFSVAALHQ